MDPNPNEETYGKVPRAAETDGTVPQDAEANGNVPKDSEVFRTSPHSSEAFREEPNEAERQLSHTLTVRETARLFEDAGVPRTERSIVNWCRPNRQGMVRLDCYFDPNERKYFLTPGSVEAVIQEERAKEQRNGGQAIPKEAEPESRRTERTADFGEREEWEREINNLKMNNHIKDKWIEQLQKQNEVAFREVKDAQYRLGRLEERLQLVAPGRVVEFPDSGEEGEGEVTFRSPEDPSRDLDLRNEEESLPR